jgi:hypothetical protein
LGNVTVQSFASGAAIISGGLMGDTAGGTSVSLGQAKGFVAAAGTVNLRSTTIVAGNVIANATGANLFSIESIFANSFPGELALIETILQDIQDHNGNLS